MNEDTPLPDSDIPTYIPKPKRKMRMNEFTGNEVPCDVESDIGGYTGNDPNILMWR